MNLLREILVPFDEGRNLPGSPTKSTLRNWRDNGVLADRSDPTSRVFIESIRIGGRPFTSIQAFHRFISKINCDDS